VFEKAHVRFSYLFKSVECVSLQSPDSSRQEEKFHLLQAGKGGAIDELREKKEEKAISLSLPWECDALTLMGLLFKRSIWICSLPAKAYLND